MSRWLSIAFSAVLVLSVAVVSGCSFTEKPATVVYRISSSPDLNPNVANQPSPVVLRFFELNSSGRFEGADFFALFNAEKSTLGPTVLDRSEVQLWPAERKELSRELQPTTRAVGIVAAFRDLNKGSWKAVLAVEKGKTRYVDVVLTKSSLNAKVATN